MLTFATNFLHWSLFFRQNVVSSQNESPFLKFFQENPRCSFYPKRHFLCIKKRSVSEALLLWLKFTCWTHVFFCKKLKFFLFFRPAFEEKKKKSGSLFHFLSFYTFDLTKKNIIYSGHENYDTTRSTQSVWLLTVLHQD